ncbi:hypothetical protein J437_LFUL005319, partial [Ladona fulva]
CLSSKCVCRHSILYFFKDDVSISRNLSIELSRSWNMFLKGLPHYASGKIVTGFGRGSKELGIPTANYPIEVVEALPPSLSTGIYYGWANIDGGPVYKMVMSIGWNPFYQNQKKSMVSGYCCGELSKYFRNLMKKHFQETHILHTFPGDLYGCLLRVCILGYIRPEKNFNSLEDLIAAIKSDIETADKALDGSALVPYRNDPFFQSKTA